MPTVSPQHGEHHAAAAEAEREAAQEDTALLEGVTSDQVSRASQESRAEGEPYEDDDAE